MRRVKSKITYSVPSLNFCNSDALTLGGGLSSATCKFCIADKSGVRCVLSEEQLKTQGRLIYKTDECCRASAGFESVIEEQQMQAPTIEPKTLMKQTIELYTKTVSDLVNQGYPRPIAEQAAKKHILGGT